MSRLAINEELQQAMERLPINEEEDSEQEVTTDEEEDSDGGEISVPPMDPNAYGMQLTIEERHLALQIKAAVPMNE